MIQTPRAGKIGWTDAHNHLQDPRLGEGALLLPALRTAGITHCVVNSTREDDWGAVARLTLHSDVPGEGDLSLLPAYGIHPWFADTAADGWTERLRDRLLSQPFATIGECGLDQWIRSPNLEVQLPVFLGQLRLAHELDRPVTIHCLKAWAGLFQAFQKVHPPPRFLLHSYAGSLEIARKLVDLGGYFSFSGYLLHPRKAAVLEVFRQLPRDRILLESDAPDMRAPPQFVTHPLEPPTINHPANLVATGHALANSLGLTHESLRQLTGENFHRFFCGAP